MSERRSIVEVLAEAQASIKRLDPRAAHDAADKGAVLIDTRSPDSQQLAGHIPGALELPLSVLEWRIDPDSESRDERSPGFEDQVILICAHGFSSSLAVQRLNQLGFSNVADVIGGFEAWRAEGLPVTDQNA
jgi:rhodanese-related sulfurtransferase